MGPATPESQEHARGLTVPVSAVLRQVVPGLRAVQAQSPQPAPAPQLACAPHEEDAQPLYLGLILSIMHRKKLLQMWASILTPGIVHTSFMACCVIHPRHAAAGSRRGMPGCRRIM